MEPVYHSVLDPMATLSYAAAVTSRIRLGVAVINAPFVSPGLPGQAGRLARRAVARAGMTWAWASAGCRRSSR